MTQIVVGIADCQTSSQRDAALVTYALGSCVCVAVFDPESTVGGLLHTSLPESSLDAEKAVKNPFIFADTGVPALLNRCGLLGADRSRMRGWLAGGSAVMDNHGIFNIGKWNQLAVRKALRNAGLLTFSEDLGGHESRTVRLELATGTFWVRSAGADQQLKANAGFARS
ncbi:MAG TPA: chemotaxis protein CheD [Bryobacteraceae bacterium]|nr:chemotaxis protein CheD [Bryobacteraceae bacterium]